MKISEFKDYIFGVYSLNVYPTHINKRRKRLFIMICQLGSLRQVQETKPLTKRYCLKVCACIFN